ncbi:Histone-lysine N-methyltransferase, partial [Phytophthora megakarya]
MDEVMKEEKEEDATGDLSAPSLDRDQEQAFRQSRVSGTRSIAVALAEIQIIERNVYVQRKERSLPEALVECIPGSCKCGDRCDNMRIQHGVMPRHKLIECGRKGLGMKLLEDIKAGSFVGEYMGEIVTEQEYYMRRVLYHNEKHRYMMVLSGGEVIDATRMGGWARFINHSCDPNCG